MSDKRNMVPMIVFSSVNAVTIILHFAVQFIIYKARLNNQQYHLVRILSITDALLALDNIALTMTSLTAARAPLEINIAISIFGYFTYNMSMCITILIVADRFIAVRDSLLYQAKVTKTRLNYVILLFGLLNILALGCLFFIGDSSRKELEEALMGTTFRSNQNVMLFSTVLRMVACIVILVIGKIFQCFSFSCAF